MNDTLENQNSNQLSEWEAKRDYRWKWMWGSLGIFVGIKFIDRFILTYLVSGEVKIWHRLFAISLLIGFIVSLISFFVCLIGWILARNECKKFAVAEANTNKEREREREE